MNNRVFVSFPYNSRDKSIIEERVAAANKYSFELTQDGDIPFAPAVVGHNMLKQCDPEGLTDISFNTWEHFCYSYLGMCDVVHVLMLPGWGESEGIKKEVKRALELNKEVIYIGLFK